MSNFNPSSWLRPRLPDYYVEKDTDKKRVEALRKEHFLEMADMIEAAREDQILNSLLLERRELVVEHLRKINPVHQESQQWANLIAFLSGYSPCESYYPWWYGRPPYWFTTSPFKRYPIETPPPTLETLSGHSDETENAR